MSLLDDLAKGQIYEEHMCEIPTQFGYKLRTEEYLFTNRPVGTVHECICGRVYVVRCPYGSNVWKETK